MKEVRSKLPEVGTSIFTTMSQLAMEHEALNLSQGFPDFQVSAQLIDRVNHFMKSGKNQYAPSPGLPDLCKVIAKMNETLYGHSSNPSSDVTIFSGATEALFATFSTLVSVGDEVILFDPAYDSYDPAIRLNGGVPIHLELRYPEFSIPWQEVEEAITPKTKVIVINNPNNPTGAVLTAEDLQELDRLTAAHDLYVVADEVYHNMVFDNKRHHSVLCLPGLADRSVAIFSFGKTLHATGWKVGYSVANAHITKELRKLHQFITFSVNTPIQFALADFMSDENNYNYLSSFFQAKRDAFLKFLEGSSFKAHASQGTYFQLLSYKGIADLGDMQMSRDMTTGHGIAAIPISVFYQKGTDNHLLRFCFAKEENTLNEAAKLLKQI